MPPRRGSSPVRHHADEATNNETVTDESSGSSVNGTPSGYPDLMGHALAYARAGLAVLPLVPGGKTPHRLAPHGKDSATSDVEQVRDLWVQAPDANIGLRPAEGIVVVDVDPRDDGDLSLAELVREHGGLRATWTAWTGGGGLHAWYRSYGPYRAKLCTGVDLKSHSGYVVAPPSLHKSGRRYVWANALPIAPAPRWLARMAMQPPRPLPAPVRPGTSTGAANDGLVRLVAQSGPHRHDRLYWAVRRAVEGGRWNADLADRLAGVSELDDTEVRRVIRYAVAGPGVTA